MKITLLLTPWEFEEVIVCMDAAKRHFLAYGMVPANEELCAINNRTRLLKKLSKTYERKVTKTATAAESGQ